MKRVYLITVTKKLLLSMLIVGAMTFLSYHGQILSQDNNSKQELLLAEEREALKHIREFLQGKTSWKKFTTSLSVALEELPQYISFCKDLLKISTVDNTDKIKETLTKYKTLLPKALQAEFSNHSETSLGIIIVTSFYR